MNKLKAFFSRRIYKRSDGNIRIDDDELVLLAFETIKILKAERNEARQAARIIMFGHDEHGHSVDTIEECYRRWEWIRNAEKE